ncbi:MAG: hypothetical protein JST00_27175 [Deltaproteobacteria bacterium]|nr:hypothetical protein [Deltaproteobacteria bacterium]
MAAAGWRRGGRGLVVAFVVGCGGAPPPPPAPPTHPAAEEHEDHELEVVNIGPPPEASRPPSTATYEEATSTPEMLDQHDTRAHLTDQQLMNPMRDVPNKCRLPKRAKVSVKVAVQNGRAIGVTTNVAWERPRPPTPSMVRAETKAATKITTCVDQTVRALVWPPSTRRDSFTTSF